MLCCYCRKLLIEKNGFKLTLGTILEKNLRPCLGKNLQCEFAHEWQLYVVCVHLSL